MKWTIKEEDAVGRGSVGSGIGLAMVRLSIEHTKNWFTLNYFRKNDSASRIAFRFNKEMMVKTGKSSTCPPTMLSNCF